ncbi:8428_t:CDS:2, partial [Dentiscutata erythropus]
MPNNHPFFLFQHHLLLPSTNTSPTTLFQPSSSTAIPNLLPTTVIPLLFMAAIRAFLHLHQRGCKLDLSLYNFTIYPQEMKNYVLDDGIIQNIRLLDDSFTKICDMVNDRSVKVRSKNMLDKLGSFSKQACTIMGSYHQVNESILLETLSQEIITHGKSWKPITGHSKSKKPRFIPTPEGDLEAELRILKSSACGAFIHGLEDAYQDVRNAAI